MGDKTEKERGRHFIADAAALVLLFLSGVTDVRHVKEEPIFPTTSATTEDQIPIDQDLFVISADLDNTAATATSLPETPTPTPTPKPVERIVTEKILNVPQFKQQHNLSCVVSSARMVSAFLGVSLSETDIIQQLPLDLNPHRGFRGNIDGPNSNFKDYGIDAEPLVDVIEVLGKSRLKAQVSYGGGLEEIKKTIDSGLPLIAWITYETQIQNPITETLANGEKVILVSQAHAVVIVGYDQSGVYVNDPHDGLRKHYLYVDFLRSWGYLGEMALTVSHSG